ncbi:MAG TPA: hypothetical protein VLW83_18430, partial [Candidatus Acidoferrales bacterium]|nr:hypothetical protein [Candidatus Acidoferrales bacterium]
MPPSRTPLVMVFESQSKIICLMNQGQRGTSIFLTPNSGERLGAQEREITIAQRSRPADLPKGAAFTACDALDPASVLAAAQGSAEIVVAIGMPYEGKLWREAWPKAIGNFVAACEKTGARMVFIDNLYMY